MGMSGTMGMAVILAAVEFRDGMMVLQFAVTVILSVVTGVLASKTRKIESLESRLESMVDLRIEEKFRMSAETMSLHIEPLIQRIDAACERLDDGEKEFDALGERNHGLELKTMTRVEQLHREILTGMASKIDLEKHQVSVERKIDRIGEHLSAQDREIQSIKTRCDQRHT